jgi:hypothetical protein
MAENQISVGAETLILFVAGNGARLLAGERPRAFGYGGVAVMARGLKSALQDPWREMKAASFDGAERPLPPHRPGPEQETRRAAIAAYFRRLPCFRFAALIRDSRGLAGDGDAAARAYEALAPVLIERFGAVVERSAPAPSAVAVVFEGPGEDAKPAERYFGRLRVRLGGGAVDVQHCFMPKVFGEPGLEVAAAVIGAALADAEGDAAQASAWPVLHADLFPDPGTYVALDARAPAGGG